MTLESARERERESGRGGKKRCSIIAKVLSMVVVSTLEDDEERGGEPVLLRFEARRSAVDPSFWQKIADVKLNRMHLSEAEIACESEFHASRNDGVDVPMFLTGASVTDERVRDDKDGNISSDSVSNSTSDDVGCWHAPGDVINFNVKERLFEMKPNEEAKKKGQELLDVMKTMDVDGSDETGDVNRLNTFRVFMHADLKKWKFFYWFLFPSVMFAPYEFMEKRRGDEEETICGSGNTKSRAECVKAWLDRPKSDFAWLMETVKGSDINTHVSSNHKLSKFAELCAGSGDFNSDRTVEICFVDNATGDAPSMSLLNVLTFLDVRFQRTIPIHVTCVRANKKGIFDFKSCLFLKRVQPLQKEMLENMSNLEFKCIGWERDEKDKLKPRKADLSSAMDPEKLARDAVDLNLKLMRWRQAPALHVDAISKSKIVLVGAGTLGCSVARTLLGWGVRNITFIDDGRVSFSNPARQSLFTFEDCLDGGKSKARAAAERLKAIVPDINANYIEMRVPMPGHAVAESERAEVLESIDTLEREIKNAEAVFLLTDTRESRWLPTLLCTAHNIQCYNCALGFDTYLAMRHGVPADPAPNRKGCYFCNDVVAPINSTRDRSLDQQCTVTRPGLAQIAGALVVELWVTASEESRRMSSGEKTNASSSIFGIHDETESASDQHQIPHQIRGTLRQFTQTIFHAPPFTNCVACSDNVVREYRDAGKAFLLDVFNSDKGDVLEVTSGIHDLLRGLSSARRQNNDGIIGDDDVNDDDKDAFGACSEEEDF